MTPNYQLWGWYEEERQPQQLKLLFRVQFYSPSDHAAFRVADLVRAMLVTQKEKSSLTQSPNIFWYWAAVVKSAYKSVRLEKSS